ncbi:helicase associated domain-containing protein [Paenarthrobacter nitroguajacolicus]|uniref:helicase associated domain-containing protein n=1 Tax=Paenarthrobacter nitroguajacolicus TaxID=211146 RepID=UPI00286512FD|nr:helicase associated domain-containing protein [Paenarthrobacter nitroguajacolicus]MDR6639598.1 hypothetical protein [Paenarthrobacter nitroguajacolicus]
MSSETRTAVESAQLIAAFYKDKGYLPTRHTPASGEHKRLASALERLRRLEAGGTLPEDAARILYRAHPHWMDRSEQATERWRRTAEDFISWVQGNGRFPSQTAEDASERFLGRWLVRQREDARRERFPARVRELDDRLPEWRETFTYQDRHSYIESAQLIAAYVQRHGTLPAPDGESSETARLARVLLVLRNQKRRGLLAKEAVQALDAAFPGGWTGSLSTSNGTGKKGPLSSSSGCRTTTDARTVTPLTPPNVPSRHGSQGKECTQSRANTRPGSRS